MGHYHFNLDMVNLGDVTKRCKMADMADKVVGVNSWELTQLTLTPPLLAGVLH